MKLKKTLALIMTAALTVGTMAGCSQATLNYSNEISKTAKWEAVTTSSEGKANIEILGVNQEMAFTSTGYATKDKVYVDMKYNNAEGKVKIPELKEYFDGTTVYMNKSYYEQTYSLNGLPVPEGLSKIKEEYIGFDSAAMGIDIEKIKSLSTKPDAMIQLCQLALGKNNNLDLPFVQNGREYTLKLDENQTADLAKKAIKAGTNNLANSNNLENLNNTLGLKLKAEDITAFDKAGYDTKLAGSTVNLKYGFTDTSCTLNYNINLQVKDFGKFVIDMKTTSIKSEVKDMTFPTSTIKLTMEQFAKLVAPASTTIASTKNVVAK